MSSLTSNEQEGADIEPRMWPQSRPKSRTSIIVVGGGTSFASFIWLASSSLCMYRREWFVKVDNTRRVGVCRK
jgi:hypothetical protein